MTMLLAWSFSTIRPNPDSESSVGGSKEFPSDCMCWAQVVKNREECSVKFCLFMNQDNPVNDIPMRVSAFKVESKGKTKYGY